MNRQSLSSDFPGLRFIDEMSPEQMTEYLRNRQVPGLEQIIVESRHPLGDGNMNITRLLKTSQGAYVLKQSVPWVAKYPSIAAPWDRSIREAVFYQTVEPVEAVSSRMPRLLDVDLPNRALLFQYEPGTQDCIDIYANPASFKREHAIAAAEWLAALHSSKFEHQQAAQLTNRDMRALNHAHIFDIPFRQNNGLDLDSITPGLADLALKLTTDGKLAKKAKELGETFYLGDGDTLLHGDYFPGSWLRRQSEMIVIDPEFAFMGHAVFDLSVSLAHFTMARCHSEIAEAFLEQYSKTCKIDMPAILALGGVETMRRILGVAQLPLEADLVAKRTWLENARDSMLAL